MSAVSVGIFLARMPPWTAGCRVFTLPPSISGCPVSLETSLPHNRHTDRLEKPLRWLLKLACVKCKLYLYFTFIQRINLCAHLTANPASRRVSAVPPEATRDSPASTSLLAKVTSPVLSDTLKSAAGEDRQQAYKTSLLFCF